MTPIRPLVDRPERLRAFGYPLLMVAVLAVTATWTSRIGYAPLRWGLLGFVALLLVLAWLGRRPGLLGPVGPSLAARLARTAGYLLIGLLALGMAVSMAGATNPDEKARDGLPVMAGVFACYLVGWLAVTARRSPATPRALATGAGIGAAAAAVWTAIVGALGPIPHSTGPAIVVVGLGMALAANANRGPGHPPGSGLLAALCAGVSAALIIVIMVAALSTFGPPWLIPDLAPAALSPAADLAQSRTEAVDPYVGLLFLGGLLALALAAVAAATRLRLPAQGYRDGGGTDERQAG